MGGEPGELEELDVALRDGEVRHRGQALASHLDRGPQAEGVGTSQSREQRARSAHPRHHRAVIEAHHQIHAHLHPAPDAFHHAHHPGMGLPQRHAVDQAHRPAGGLELGLEDERVVTVTATDPADWASRRRWADAPEAVPGVAQQLGEAGRRVKARQAQPVHRTVPADQRSRVGVADDPVILDARQADGHLWFFSAGDRARETQWIASSTSTKVNRRGPGSTVRPRLSRSWPAQVGYATVSETIPPSSMTRPTWKALRRLALRSYPPRHPIASPAAGIRHLTAWLPQSRAWGVRGSVRDSVGHPAGSKGLGRAGVAARHVDRHQP